MLLAPWLHEQPTVYSHLDDYVLEPYRLVDVVGSNSAAKLHSAWQYC